MTRDAVIETLETLAMSQGSYGRLLNYLSDVRDVDPDKFDEIMTALERCDGPVDMIMMIEG